MSDSFLEDQVRRIKGLTERMAQVTNRSEVQEEIARQREAFGYGPLHTVRDVRVVNSVPESKTGRDEDLSVSASRRRRRR